MKPAKKTKKTLLERVLGTEKREEVHVDFAPQTPPEPNEINVKTVEEQAEQAIAAASISPEHAPYIKQLISTSLSTQSSLTRETY